MKLVSISMDMKLASISTKKIKIYESKVYKSAYITPLESKPTTEFEHTEIVKDYGEASTSIGAEVPGAVAPVNTSASVKKPQHAFSTNCVSDHTKPVPHTTAPSTFTPPTQLGASATTQTPVSDPGGGCCCFGAQRLRRGSFVWAREV